MPTTPLPQATADDALAISEQLGLGVSRDDAPEYAWLVTEQSRAYEAVAAWDPTGGSYTEDRCFTIPDDADNPQHAWSCRTEITATGATIIGKPHTEYLCLSGDSHTNYFADTQNPWREGYSAGGSSSGSGVVVALGEADMALGADQGGPSAAHPPCAGSSASSPPTSSCRTRGSRPWRAASTTWGP